MSIEVVFFANLREIVGKKKIHASANSIGELLENILKEHEELEEEIFKSETRELKDFITILVNGERIELLDGMETKLNDGDRIVILPPAAGG